MAEPERIRPARLTGRVRSHDRLDWEQRVLAVEGAAERVAEVEEELRLAAGLTALRERAGLSPAEVAERIGVSQPRVAAIERSAN
ncbi:helix-turn-helix transcriptional regulator [Dactylosporangium sp. NPDC000555]|uniref:helix-turn-helix domain-containing protein n=1 Tax=Dactylosporangium sp. NPDC000555 TaxID=3154260 RepID=UPI00331D3FA5